MSLSAVALLGSQAPRVLTEPPSRWSHADDAAFLASGYGLTPDEWQLVCLEAMLGVRDDGKWSASRCGLAVPRQNGKNGVLEVVELYLTVVLGYKILHTAHEVKTARKAFLRLISFFENEREYPELAAMVSDIRRTNGQEAIILNNGGSVEFIARSKGSGRGFTVDVIVADEAQELSEESMAALRPTLSSAPKGDPKVIMTGTPPSPTMDGAYWTRMRAIGIKGKDPRLSWVEWSVEGVVDLDDHENWAATNPALGTRMNLETIQDERADMDDVTFARERLGMWDSDTDLRIIPSSAWVKRATDTPATVGKVAFSLEISAGLEYVSISAARRGPDAVHVELVKDGSAKEGTQWIIDWLSERDRRNFDLVIDARSAAAFMIEPLRKAGVKVVEVNTRFVADACAAFLNAVLEGGVTHFDQHQMNRAVAGASRRSIGSKDSGVWAWGRMDHNANITPLVSATQAFAHVLHSKNTSRAPRRII